MDQPSSDEVMCRKHGQKYHYFCDTCQELACLECVVIDHPAQSHTYTNLETAAVEGKKSTQALLTRLEKKLPELKESLGVFKKLHPILKNHSKQANQKVQAFAAKIREEVTKQENHLVEEIRRESYQQSKDLKLTCESLSESITHARFSLETGSVFTKRSTDSEFLRRRAIVEKDLYRLVDKQLPSVPKALRFLERAGGITLGELKEVDVERFIRKSNQETTSSSGYFSPRPSSQQKPKQKDIPLKETANAGDVFAKFQPKPGDWKCDTCLFMFNNKADAMSCIACMTPKPKTSSPSFASKPPSQNTGSGVSVNLSSGGGFSFGTNSLGSGKTSGFQFGAPLPFGSTTSISSAPAFALPSGAVKFGSTQSESTSTTTTLKAPITSHQTSQFTLGAAFQNLDLGGSGDKASQPVCGSQPPSAGFSFGAKAEAAGSSATANVASSRAQQVSSVKPSGGFAFGASISTSSTQPSNGKPQYFCFADTAKSKGSTFSFRLDDGKTTVASPEKSPGLNKSIDNAKIPPTNTIQPTIPVSSSKSIVGSSTLLASMLVRKDVNYTSTPSAKPGSIIGGTPPKSPSSTKMFTTTQTAVAKPTTQKANQKQQGLLTTLQFSNSGGIFGSASLTHSVAPFQAAKSSDKTASLTSATISATISELSFKACQLASGNTQQKPSQASAAATSTSQAPFAGFTFREFKSSKKMTATSGSKGSNEVPKTFDKTANPTSATISASSVVSNFSGNTQQKPSQSSAAATSTSHSPFACFNFGKIKPLNTMASTFGNFASKGSNELPKASDKTTNATTATISASSALSNVSFNANQLAAFGNTRQKPSPTPQASSATTTACQSPLTGLKFGSPTFGFVARGTPGRLDTNECHDNDVIFVSEKQPTPDQRARAEALMLPPTYFLYEDEPPCPGCVGCDPEDLAARGITLSKHSPSPKASGGKKKGSLVAETPSLLSTKESSQPIFGSSGTSTISFASRSSDNQGTFAQGGQKGFSFPKAGALVFDNNNKESTAEGQEYDPHFDPIVELPELVDVKTGEEDEEVMYTQRARLYRFVEDLAVWKERGIGDVKLLRHRDTGLLRLIMRREQVLKLCANHRISPDLKLNSMEPSDRTWVWYATDYAEGEPCHEQFAIKFKTPKLAHEFKQRLEELQAARREEEMMVSGSPEKADEVSISKAAGNEKTDATAREGESAFFAFGASTSTSPTTQPRNEKPESVSFADMAKSKGSTSFRLDVSKTTEASPEKTPKPKSPGFMKSPRMNKSGDNEYVVELPESIAVKTGEEDEISRFRHRANLFRFDKKTSQWKERGTGDIKLLYNLSKRKYRIVMRREHVLKVCANHYVTPELKLEPNAGSTKSWVWMAMDSSENQVQVEQFAVRFKTEEAAGQFKDAIDAAQEDMKTGDKELMKETKEDDSVDFEEGRGDTTAGVAIEDGDDVDQDDVAKGNSDQDDDDIDEEVVEEEQDTVKEQNLVFTKAQDDNIKIQRDRGDINTPDMPEEQDKTALEGPVDVEGCDQNEDDDNDDYEDAVDGQDEKESKTDGDS